MKNITNGVRIFFLASLIGLVTCLSVPRPVWPAVADFCWCGFFITPSAAEGRFSPDEIYPVFNKFAGSYERRGDGVIHRLLKQLQWDEMTYHGYVGLTGGTNDSPGPLLENLANAYGFFLSVDQCLSFDPDEITIFEKTFLTHTTYLFGTLNLINLETQNLIYSRPFVVTHQAKKPTAFAQMLDYALAELNHRLLDPTNEYTAKMKRDLQLYFGERGEQNDALRMISGTLTDTYGAMPVCDRCVRSTVSDLNASSLKKLRTFVRLFVNVKMAEFKQVVPSPEKHGDIQETLHTFVVKTKAGDVRYVASSYTKYDESGQSLLQINIPEPANKVRLGVRYVVNRVPVNENVFNRQYNTLLDIQVERPDSPKKETYCLTNKFEKTITASRKPSDVYYFITLINAVSRLNENLF